MFPVLLKLGPLSFYSYGFVLGWACFFSANLMVWLASRDAIDTKIGWRFAIGSIAAGFVGSYTHARLTDTTLQTYQAGFTFYGAALSGTIAAIPIARWLKTPYWKFADATAPALALAHSMGRVGCFLYGCCFGKCAPEGSPWGITFPGPLPLHPPGSPAWNHHRDTGLITPYATRSLPVYPTQLIEAGWDLVVFLGLTLYVYRRPKRTGTALLVYYLLYGPLRIWVETLRDDPGRGTILGVSTSTAIGVATSAVAGILLLPPLAKLRPLRSEAPAQ